MSRNLKVIGLALVSVFAMSAMAASSAQAAVKLTASEYPTVVTAQTTKHTAEEKEPFAHTLTFSGGMQIACKKTRFVGTLAEASEKVTIIPTYEECSVKIGSETLLATVTVEDCYDNVHGGTKEAEEDKWEKGEVDLVCPEGKAPVIHVFQSEAKHTKNENLCTFTVSPFVNKQATTFVNTTGAPDDVSISFTLPNIAVTRTGSVLCGGASQTATYTGSSTLQGFKDLGKATPENGTLKEVEEGAQIGLTISE